MKHFFSLTLIYSFLIFPGFPQSTVNVKNPERVIRFINLSAEDNSPYFRKNRELPMLVMHAILSGEIHPYYIDYENNGNERLLLIEQYIRQISYEPDSPYAMLFFPRDFYTIGLDQTIGEVKGKEIAQVHYINFYAPDFSGNEKTIKYRFSVKWDDFIKVLNAHLDKLYYTNSYGGWWRGNIFLTHSGFAIDAGDACRFIKLSKSIPEFKAEDYRNPGRNYDLGKYKEEDLKEGYPLDFFLIENYSNHQYSISKVLVEEIPDWFVYGNGNRFAFDWNEFLEIAEDSSWRSRSEVFTLLDAFKLQKFTYSEDVVHISRKGKFLKGGKDVLCGKELISSFSVETPETFENFYTDGLEGIFLGDPLNEHLHRPGHSLVELAMKYVFSGKVGAFRSDSLLTPITIEEFYKNASELIDAEEFYNSKSYNKGDTILFEEKYFILTEDIDPYTIDDHASLLNVAIPFAPALYDPQKLIPLQLVQKITFDKEGKNKKYELQGIGLIIPNNINYKGIELPIGFIMWEELRSELLADPAAMIDYKGKKVNLVELMENRHFFSAFYRTGFLHAAE